MVGEALLLVDRSGACRRRDAGRGDLVVSHSKYLHTIDSLVGVEPMTVVEGQVKWVGNGRSCKK